jgi:peptide chain release factor 1
MKDKIEKAQNRLRVIEGALQNQAVIQDQSLFKKYSKEHRHLTELVETFSQIERLKKELEDNLALLRTEKDEEMKEMIDDTVHQDTLKLDQLEKKLEELLVPPDPNDSRTTILEIRAGTGGDEAALFVADCVRMYQNYANQKGWGVELLSSSESDLGGFKEYIMSISGPDVHRFLQYEAGTHRVQRVPETETQGRVHTSTVTVAVLMEPDDQEQIGTDEKDLRIDTYRSSGAGGQHVNTTDSAVRITHIPTGIVVTCQEERSQHKNKDKAMRYLKAKILEEREKKLAKERGQLRSLQIGSGDRSERIRTYNFPQNRLTDHRINLTKHNLDQVMMGTLDEITSTLVSFYHQKKIESA